MERIFSSVRRTAAALQSAAGGHSELGMAVYGAKCEGEGLRALGHHHIHGENGGSQGRGRGGGSHHHIHGENGGSQGRGRGGGGPPHPR